MRPAERLLRSSSYQTGGLFALLILMGMGLAAFLLYIAVSDPDINAAAPSLGFLLALIASGLLLVLVLIFALSYGVTYYVATRFERMANTTERIIVTGNLSERLPVDSSWDDLSKVSALLNSMLEELEVRVDGIKSVSDNIAHDLRTPLMRLRTSIEAETEGTARERLLLELDDTLTIFRSLLRISAIEAGKQSLDFIDLDLSQLLADARELYEPVLEEKSQRLVSTAPGINLRGDRDLLFQCVANLIDNASKFSPVGSEIEARIHREGDKAVLQLSDRGPGIPAADRERVLQRFQRLDKSRSQPGNGLGLPLVAAIAHRHGGELRLQERHDGDEGLCAELRLPLDADGAEITT